MRHASRASGLAAGLAAMLLVASSGTAARTQEPERATSPEPAVRAAPRLVPQRQWEYRQLPCTPTAEAARERSEFLEKLNDAGRHGWELVGLAEVRQVPGRECLLATFKRQVTN